MHNTSSKFPASQGSISSIRKHSCLHPMAPLHTRIHILEEFVTPQKEFLHSIPSLSTLINITIRNKNPPFSTPICPKPLTLTTRYHPPTHQQRNITIDRVLTRPNNDIKHHPIQSQKWLSKFQNNIPQIPEYHFPNRQTSHPNPFKVPPSSPNSLPHNNCRPQIRSPTLHKPFPFLLSPKVPFLLSLRIHSISARNALPPLLAVYRRWRKNIYSLRLLTSHPVSPTYSNNQVLIISLQTRDDKN